MLAFIENPNLLIKEFNELIDVSQTKAFITVGIEIQKTEIETLNQYRLDLLELKKEFVSRGLENEANLVFCIEGSVKVIQYELEMLVNIKEDKMAAAWGNLVNAQTLIGPINRNYPFDENHLLAYMERLSNYEKLLFPKMFFQSTGGIIKKSECSICHQDLNMCEHLKGRLYMGEMCCRLISEMDLEEVSFVDHPANKHCRVITIQSGDRKWDVLTLREVHDDTMKPEVEVKN